MNSHVQIVESEGVLTERSRPFPAPRTDPMTTDLNPTTPPRLARIAQPTTLLSRCPARSPDACVVPAPRRAGCALSAERERPGLGAAPTATGRTPRTAHAVSGAPAPEAPSLGVQSPAVLASGGPVVAVPNADPTPKDPSRTKGDHFRWS